MKLVFYSGGYPEENKSLDRSLKNLVKHKKSIRMGFIPSSHDLSDQEFTEFVQQYEEFNVKKIVKVDLDLQPSKLLIKELLKCDIIHLGGGNTYYFLKYLRKEKLLKTLKSWVQDGGILTGLSAGAILMTTDISTAGFPEFDKDDNEENIKNLNALALVDFDFFPHYKSSKRYDQELLAFSEKSGRPLYACPDGAGIVINGETKKFIGKTACFYSGKKFFISK